MVITTVAPVEYEKYCTEPVSAVTLYVGPTPYLYVDKECDTPADRDTVLKMAATNKLRIAWIADEYAVSNPLVVFDKGDYVMVGVFFEGPTTFYSAEYAHVDNPN